MDSGMELMSHAAASSVVDAVEEGELISPSRLRDVHFQLLVDHILHLSEVDPAHPGCVNPFSHVVFLSGEIDRCFGVVP